MFRSGGMRCWCNVPTTLPRKKKITLTQESNWGGLTAFSASEEFGIPQEAEPSGGSSSGHCMVVGGTPHTYMPQRGLEKKIRHRLFDGHALYITRCGFDDPKS